ncbi:hypothetical protein VTO42DRAFT_8789 [Malbranchea cinnamomea]
MTVIRIRQDFMSLHGNLQGYFSISKPHENRGRLTYVDQRRQEAGEIRDVLPLFCFIPIGVTGTDKYQEEVPCRLTHLYQPLSLTRLGTRCPIPEAGRDKSEAAVGHAERSGLGKN